MIDEKEIQKLNNMLSNKNFITNAKPQVIQANKKALEKAKIKITKIKKEISILN